MKLLVGLGNPGDKYAGHRHNIGFHVIDKIADDYGFPAFKSKFKAQIAEGRIAGVNDKIMLMKPQTFMNESGRAVAEAVKFYKLDLSDVFVFHDELDLVPGKMRVKFDGGHAGHNGLRSIMACMGGQGGFWRVRLGIGHPGDKSRVSGYVLSDFAKAERESYMQPWIDALSGEVSALLSGAEEDYMTNVSRKVPLPKAKKKEEE